MSTTIYTDITNQIIAAMESGEFEPMRWARDGVPRNAESGRAYSGVNSLVLWVKKELHAADGWTNTWLTYKQAAAIGGQVRKGEKGNQVVFYKPLTVEDKAASSAGGTPAEKTIPMLRTFTVFNSAQIDGLPEAMRGVSGTVTPSPSSIQESLCVSAAQGLLSQATIIEGGDGAFYHPLADEIHMPDKARFATLSDWHATALHELTHWTGHKSRLDRFADIGSKEGRAREELIAELGSAFLSARIGFDGLVRGHASYIDSWIQLLKSDQRAIFKAAAAAQKACDLIHKEQSQAAFDERLAA